MKTLKNIFIPAFLFLTVFSYLGHGIVDYYCHVPDRIENTASGKGAQGSVIQESSQSEDSHSILTGIIDQTVNSKCEPIVTPVFFFPPKLFYSVWLPPELS
jgi:hypothetical protein